MGFVYFAFMRNYRGKSRFRIFPLTATGANKALAPSTTSVLNIFDPIILPIAISLLPCSDAVMLTAASGKLVPNATTVSPTIYAGILNFADKSHAPSTNKIHIFDKDTEMAIVH